MFRGLGVDLGREFGFFGANVRTRHTGRIEQNIEFLLSEPLFDVIGLGEVELGPSPRSDVKLRSKFTRQSPAEAAVGAENEETKHASRMTSHHGPCNGILSGQDDFQT